MRLSILIKTYNEAEKIETCLRSVLEAIRGIEGGVEIIVADSLSTDATIEIVKNYPAKLVQLRDASDRGCGTGVQLGFQHAAGRFVYLLDGDMELQRSFLLQALEMIESNDEIGGISGIALDKRINNWFDRHRLKTKSILEPRDMEWLGGGGLYRRAAIEQAGGYAGNRNLKAYEEAELGLRLRSRGWRLMRIPVLAILHTGHVDSTYSLVARHFRSGRLDSGGVLLKIAITEPWRGRVARLFIHPLCTLLYWFCWLVCLVFVNDWRVFSALAVLGLSIYIASAVKKRSLTDAFISLLLWHVTALGILRGLMIQKWQPPASEIPSRVLNEGA
ncbi:MAG TPA: glycosyltransferase [Nitrosospira sp.]|nr:glycosyltransferase [Nitrosospira sp.]